ncbi:hypothetical protein IWQ62_001841 [Dispira parvispora]|uniref:Peptide hydrolase n=1 Tax=Dispira parvispora TaxID=1520584 RepID=A0A9W8AWZ5_9FUNG|nr:hypothetical protein IWQ62_001841 [Dispira parvispora]
MYGWLPFVVSIFLVLTWTLLSLCWADGLSTALDDNLLIDLAQLTQHQRLDPLEGDLLTPFLIKRVPGTMNNTRVQEYILGKMKALGWHIDLDAFSDDTPLGRIDFRNIIATKNPQAPRRLVLSAHFDSKYYPPEKGVFIGATDSAVPCALLLELAETLDKFLDEQADSPITLQLIFFDGEESFMNESREDFIWGSKHLAKVWEEVPGQSTISSNITRSVAPIRQIELMVLLDLLGAGSPSFPDYFPNTSKMFHQLAQLESRLKKLFLLSPGPSYFDTVNGYRGSVLDDHVPFIDRDVPVLHLIPSPFPKVWHTMDDNEEALVTDAILNFSVLMRAFVASYLKHHRA